MVSDDTDVYSPGPLTAISDASCIPHPGAGVVARWGNILLVVEEADPTTVSMLIEQCEAVATVGGDGRTLSRRLAALLTESDELMPAFAAAAPVETGLAVFVHGSAAVTVGKDFTVSGDASLSWVDRLIPWPVTTVRLSAGSDTGPLDGPYELQQGVVPGSGLTLTAVPTTPRPSSMAVQEAEVDSAHAPPEEEPASTPPLDRWPGQAGDPPTFESIVMDTTSAGEDEEAARPALPLATDVREHSDSMGHMVRGVYCKNGHFNDPRGLFCAVCGINMVQQTPVLVEGSRPPLGVLLLADGSAFQLDDDYMLGREPTHDDDVRAGRLRGIVLHDEAQSVSRAHARIELRQWDVVVIDNGSSNGTYVAIEGESTWTPLAPGAPHVLSSGSRLRLGGCTLTFNAYRGE